MFSNSYKDRVTSENITSLEDNEIFVFGSNLSGIHGKGSANDALKWGAIWHQGIGRQGNTYAIPTKDRTVRNRLRIDEIEKYVSDFIEYASNNPDLLFLVTKIGCNYARYTPKQIAPLFK